MYCSAIHIQRNREECGWIGNTQRGQNCIYLIFDGIHYNALKLNGEQIQPENDTLNVRSDTKEKRKRKCSTPEAANTTHTKTTQANAKDDKTGKSEYNQRQVEDNHEAGRAKRRKNTTSK